LAGELSIWAASMSGLRVAWMLTRLPNLKPFMGRTFDIVTGIASFDVAQFLWTTDFLRRRGT
jgi:hypothetical protein